MNRIGVFIVDDSAVIRRLLSEILSGDPALEVVGNAADGRAALSRISLVHPDIVILDVDMPEMDGLQALAALRQQNAALPVVMFSSLTERGAAATLDALSLGASDYVAKPSGAGSAEAAAARVRAELIPKIKALCPRGSVAERGVVPAAEFSAMALHAAPAPEPRVDIVAIAVSTGGPNALEKILPELPAELPVPIVIAQHMPKVFTKLLAERLASKSAIAVAEAADGDVLRPGSAWIAPGDFHLALERQPSRVLLRTHQDEPENSCRPSADVLFRSVADVFGRNALALVMTGMGQDGLRGCERIQEVGGRVVVQDQMTSIVWGMPGGVARAGLADKILPLEKLAREIVARVRIGRDQPAEQHDTQLNSVGDSCRKS